MIGKSEIYRVWQKKVTPLAQNIFFLPCRKPFSDLYTFPYLNANWRTNRKNLGTFFFQFLLHIWWLIFQSFRTDVCRIFRIEHWQFLLHFSHDQNTFLWSHTRSLLTLHSSTSDAILSCAEKIYQAKMDDAREREREREELSTRSLTNFWFTNSNHVLRLYSLGCGHKIRKLIKEIFNCVIYFP